MAMEIASSRPNVAVAAKPQEGSVSQLTEHSTQVLRLVSSLSTHPLISVAAVAYVLGLLYLPRHVFSLLLHSPVSLSTLLLLLAALLHLASSSAPPEPRHAARSGSEEKVERHLPCPPRSPAPDTEPSTPAVAVPGSPQKPVLLPEHQHLVVDWARRGPLEVIYEEYEGEEEEEEEEGGGDSRGCSRSPERAWGAGMQGLQSLGVCFCDDDSASESDSEASPAWESPEDLCLRWEMEDDGLIEISLEEETLIEIDISACP